VMSVLDSLLGTSQRSIPELVEALREIHNSKTSRAQATAAKSESADRRERPDFSSLLHTLILEGFARGSEDLARMFASAPAATQPAADERRYGALRGRLEGMEREARENSEAVDRLLGFDSARKSTRPAYQETLHLQCPQGGRSGGRFRCVNRRGQRTSVSAVPRPFSTTSKPLQTEPMLTLRPDNFCLEAGQSQLVWVEVDLAPCSGLASGTLGTSIDLLMNDAVGLKVWIEIDVYHRI
jgi:hypothetical protein